MPLGQITSHKQTEAKGSLGMIVSSVQWLVFVLSLIILTRHCTVQVLHKMKIRAKNVQQRPTSYYNTSTIKTVFVLVLPVNFL